MSVKQVVAPNSYVLRVSSLLRMARMDAKVYDDEIELCDSAYECREHPGLAALNIMRRRASAVGID